MITRIGSGSGSVRGAFLFFCASLLAHAQVSLVRHAPTLNGTVEGSLQQLTAENVTLSGNGAVTGDLLIPGTPTVRLNGSPVFGGIITGTGSATPSNHQLTINGSARLGHLRTRTDPVAWPTVNAPPAPSGTRSVSLNGPGQNAGDFTSLRNLTLNGNAGQVVIPPGVYGDFTANGNSGFTLGIAGAVQPAAYALQRLTLNGNSELRVAGPVVLTLANGVTLNGTAGSSTYSAWLTLKIAAGNLTLNGNVVFHGYVVAPAGTVTINGNSQLIGGVAADRLVLNGAGFLKILAANEPPSVALTAPSGGATFTAPATIALQASATDGDGTVVKVEFFNGTAKLGESTVMPYRFVWNGVPVGTYAIMAKATDNLGAVTTSSTLTLSVTSALNRPPQVSLDHPQSGAVLNGPAALLLSATATDPDGTITKIEFLDGETKLGESTVPIGLSTFKLNLANGLSAGGHVLTARATDNNGARADSAGVTITVLPTLPYTVNFESLEGYRLEPLHGQQGWRVSQGAAGVISGAAFDGSQSVEMNSGATGAGVQQVFATTSSLATTFVDLWVHPVAGTDALQGTRFEFGGARISFVREGTAGRMAVFQADGFGAGTWQLAGPVVGLNGSSEAARWVRLTARLDFTAGRWDLFVDGQLAVFDLPFSYAGTPPSSLTTFSAQGVAAQASRFDFLYAGYENPLFADADWDGMDDAWERAHGLDPTVNDRNGDKDEDGLSNFREFQLGLKPDNSDTDGDGLFDGDEVAWNWGATSPNPDTIPPTVPTGLTATGIRTDRVTLNWQPATDNLRVAGYLVFRNGQPLSTAEPIRGTAYTDGGLPGGETFHYALRAFDFAGNLSPLSDPLPVRTADGDTDANGLADSWELKYFGDTGVSPNDDPDGDGKTNAEEFTAGTDPKDFFNGINPRLETLFNGGPGPDDELAMYVLRPDGSPWAAAPARFTITEGRRRLSVQKHQSPYEWAITVRADASGLAKCYLEPLPSP